MDHKDLFRLNLALFGDGGDGAGATADSGLAATSVTEQNAPAQTVAADDRQSAFEALIKGEYKDLYDAKVQDTISKRLKGTKETVEKYDKLMPTLELMAKKYGVKSDDIDALNRAIEDDDTYFEDEALERGCTVEQLKEIRRVERENAALKKQMQERETQERANQLYAAWLQQADSTKAVYPSFNLDAELQNQKFVDLLRSNIDVRTAYEVIHKDEIIPAAMNFTAKQVESKLAKKIAASGNRPNENGTSSSSASLTGRDVASMTKEERAQLIKRVQMGERITF